MRPSGRTRTTQQTRVERPEAPRFHHLRAQVSCRDEREPGENKLMHKKSTRKSRSCKMSPFKCTMILYVGSTREGATVVAGDRKEQDPAKVTHTARIHPIPLHCSFRWSWGSSSAENSQAILKEAAIIELTLTGWGLQVLREIAGKLMSLQYFC